MLLDTFFLYGNVPTGAVTGSYSWPLVLASYLVAACGSYAGLSLLIERVNAATRDRMRLLHAMAATALGCGIWSMHFIGMLAYKMSMPVHYNLWLTAASLVIVIAFAYAATLVTNMQHFSISRILLGAIILGFGICCMHYLGMAAMDMQATMLYVPSLFFLSIIIAVTASAAALIIAFTLGRHQKTRWKIVWRVLAALIMGVAICGMHYTGAAAAIYLSDPSMAMDHVQADDNNLMATAIITVTTILLTILTFSVASRLFLVVGFGFLFSLPLGGIVYQTISDSNQKIANTQMEQVGLIYHKAAINLILHLQEYRGLTFMARNGNTEAGTRLPGQRDILLHDLQTLDELGTRFGAVFNLSTRWKSTKEQIMEALNAPEHNGDALQQFNNFTYTLIYTFEFLNVISDHSKITLDPELPSAYLLEVATRIIPRSIEALGKMRGLISGWAANATGTSPLSYMACGTENTETLRHLNTTVMLQDDLMINTLWLADHADPATHAFVDYRNNTLEADLNAFEEHIKPILLGQQTDVDSSLFFKMVSTTIHSYEIFYSNIMESLRITLEKRESNFVQTRNVVIGFSLIAFLGYFTLLVVLYQRQQRVVIQLSEMKALKDKLQTHTDALVASHKELEISQNKADTANKAKSEFLANMSHELRTPLNSIMGMSRLLCDSPIEREYKDLSDIIYNASTNLLNTVNDILDISKIEATEMKLENIGFDAVQSIKAVVSTLMTMATQKGLRLIVNCEKPYIPYLLGDPTRFARIVMNLIGNAIKYTEKGQITVSVDYHLIDHENIILRCSVTDTGIGIPAERQQEVFKKFVQADISTTRKYGGTGLGLAITKELVEIMGGTIGVESAPHVGSKFWFSIPFKTTNELHKDDRLRRLKATIGTLPVRQARVLIAEDQPMNQILIKKFLATLGFQNTEIVGNGRLVVEKFQEKRWDIVLMDCHMPEMNGYDASRAIRDIEKTRGSDTPTTIIAMTADVMIGNREECLRNGMNEFISKPILLDRLKETLGQWVQFDGHREI